MNHNRPKSAIALPLVLAVAVVTPLLTPNGATAEPATRVFLNGRPTPVFFNDGDSFRVLAGPLQGSKARLAGFNTLESHGSVHRWGTWRAKELYWNAKLATLNARRGVWRCVSKDMKKDTYGRILWYCKGLAIDQISKGFAHAMTINYEPSPVEYRRAQADAIKHRRGMWAHGVPAYILTSLHSAAEGGGKDGKTYNRVVSTVDGHSAKWRHADNYKVCQWVCREETVVTEKAIRKAVGILRGDPELKGRLGSMNPHLIWQVAADFTRLGYFGGVRNQKLRNQLTLKLDALKAANTFGYPKKSTGSCVLYVPFEQRFGRARASCLDK